MVFTSLSIFNNSFDRQTLPISKTNNILYPKHPNINSKSINK